MRRFFLRGASITFLIFLVFTTVMPSIGLAAGTCALRCTHGSDTRNLPASRAENSAACDASCRASSPPCGADACEGIYTSDTPDPPPPVHRLACSCVCVEPRGGPGRVTVTSDATCPVAAPASAPCRSLCDVRCMSGVAPVSAGMLRSFDADPSCEDTVVAPSGPASPDAPGGTGSPPAPAPAGPTAPGAGSSPQAPVNRESVPLTLSQAIGGVTEVSDLPHYIALWYRYAIGLSATAAIIMVIYGGFRYLLGSAMGDVASGQQIIKDAIIGMLLVLGAYTILNTVNPNTLTLQVPSLKKIAHVHLEVDMNSSSGAPQRDGVPCALDNECPNGEACLRSNFRSRNGTENDAEILDVVADEQEKMGVCTNGTLGQHCFCSGRGCELSMTGDQWAVIRGIGGYGTNHGLTGKFACQNSLKCIFDRPESTGFFGWYCQERALREPTIIGDVRARIDGDPTCTSDSECAARGKRACVSIGNVEGNRDSARGECSNGALGERCKCRGIGCNMPIGVLQIETPCAAPLTCQLFQYAEEGFRADWFCAPPP